MKCISLWQPFATLIALKKKQFETRSWTTSYTGPLAIHAACKFDVNCWDWLFEAASGLNEEQAIKTLPRGHIIAVVELQRPIPTRTIAIAGSGLVISDQERAFGDYSDNRFAWPLRDIRPLKEPVAARGFQRLWNLPPDIESKVRAQL